MQNTAEKTADTFSASLPIVAAALGNSCGVTVEFGASVPNTDGRTIRLPDLAVNSRDEERRILGLLCHECGHVRFTDMDDFDDKATALERSLDNSLEDVRIERAMSGIYPGAEALFAAAHREAVEKLTRKRSLSLQSGLPLYALCLPECKLLGRQYMQPLAEKLRRSIVKQFGETTAQRLDELALSVGNASSLKDVQAIRRAIVKELQLIAEPPEDRRSDPDRSEGTGQGGAESSSSGDAAQDGTASADDAPCGDRGALAQAILGATEHQADNPLSLSEAFKKLRGRGCSAAERLQASGTDVRPIKGSAERGARLVALGKSDSTALRRALVSLVQSRLDAGIRHSDQGRRLETRRLSRLFVGDARVFRKSNPKRTSSAAVHVLLDLSGSMGSVGAELGLRASLGLIHALQGIRHVNPALTVFPGAACGLRQYATCTVVPHGTRLERVDVREIGGIESWGPTPIEPALRTAGKALAGCREAAKIVLLVTDGVISASRLRNVKAELEAAGVRIFGIQIGCDSGLAQLLPRSISIQTVEELKTALFSLTRDAFCTL